MEETMVGLEGSATSLAQMSTRFSSPRLTIIDEGNGTGYLRSSDFPLSDDNALIIEEAERLLSIANATMRQRTPLFFQPVKLRSIVVLVMTALARPASPCPKPLRSPLRTRSRSLNGFRMAPLALSLPHLNHRNHHLRTLRSPCQGMTQWSRRWACFLIERTGRSTPSRSMRSWAWIWRKRSKTARARSARRGRNGFSAAGATL